MSCLKNTLLTQVRSVNNSPVTEWGPQCTRRLNGFSWGGGEVSPKSYSNNARKKFAVRPSLHIRLSVVNGIEETGNSKEETPEPTLC